MKLARLAVASASIVFAGCAVQPKTDLRAFLSAAPRSILVVPAINKSLDVDAPNYLLATLPVPLAEKGFYVFPVNTTKVVLEREGYYEGEQIHRQPTEALAKLFGADAVLYVTINRWDAQFALIVTTVTVDFDYRIVYKDGNELWRANQKMQYSPQTSDAGHPVATLIAAVISAAITRAAPNYIPLAQQANSQVFITGPTAIPNGPYRDASKYPPVRSASSGDAASPALLPLVVAIPPAPSKVSDPVVLPSPAAENKNRLSVVPIPAPPDVSSPAGAKQLALTPTGPAPAVIEVNARPAQTPTRLLSGGQDAYQAERTAKTHGCSITTAAQLVAKGPGYETYKIACRDTQVMSLHCEFGNCALVK